MGMQVYIDPAGCDGHAVCVRVAPGLFKLGSDGKSHIAVATIKPEDEALVYEAEAACPMSAIVALPDE
jgi:ferredoxin